jgi:mannosyltransferase
MDKRRRLAALAGITAVGAVLRLYRLGNDPLWLDEAASAAFVSGEYSTIELVTQLPFEDPHPPLYYLILDGWTTVAGTGEWALRAPSAVASTLAILVMFALGRRLMGGRAGLVVALITAVSPHQVAAGQQARMYSVLFLLTAISTVALLRWLDDSSWRRAALYVVPAALLGWAHIFGVFTLAAHGAYGLHRVRRDVSARRWVAGQTVIAAALAPALVAVLSRVVGGDTGGLAWIDRPTLLDIPYAVGAVAVGPLNSAWAVVGLWGIAMGLYGLYYCRDRVGSDGLALALLVVAPVGIAVVLSWLVTPIFVPRYLIGSAVGLYALAGAGLVGLSGEFPTPRARSLAALGLVSLVAIGMAGSVMGYHAAPPSEEWESAVEHTEQLSDEDSLVLITDDYAATPARYYAGDGFGVAVDDNAPPARLANVTADTSEVVVLKSNAEAGVLNRLERVGWTEINRAGFAGVDVIQYGREVSE